MKSQFSFKTAIKTAGVFACIAFMSACNSDNEPDTPAPIVNFTEVKGSGDITAQLNAFRALLGDQLNTTPGQTAGRREINWDAVPDNQTNTDTFPGDFFNSTDPAVAAGRKRGAIFSTPGKGLRISDKNFSDLVSNYGEQFSAFSPARTFAAVGSNKMDVTFKVPGTATNAFVRGFGVVLSDVDQANSTTLEFFEGEKSLGKFTAPVRKDGSGFSFVGAVFPDSKVTKVTITTGSAAISNKYADNAQNDLVIMDDFFYSEPVAAQ
ncbi:hypothetical protein [Dyadobacter aurulentus]|uniref:hypothetical protein n=1 Tax=Dyadobacter sp. UC 10 TaxID=2605428 RepID=UPI0011F33D72|nr:hypothetical protein [Dyadobacter sp. UC 10]KAA0992127.1 hypothetical protein FXO21_19060 [Dyadobacter sp. UC 10]